MRGALLNYVSGMGDVVASGAPAFNMDIGEMMFWAWRVKSILVTFSLSATIRPPEEGEGTHPPIPSYSFSNVYYCPTVQLEGTTSSPSTEKDQCITRSAFASQPYPRFGGIQESQFDEDGSREFDLAFSGGSRHDPIMPETHFWFPVFRFDAGISNNEGDVFAVNTTFSPGFESTSFAIVVRGTDLILGRSYDHHSVNPGSTINVFQQRGGRCSGGTGSLIIEPFEYQEWRDQNGVPLYNAITGGYA